MVVKEAKPPPPPRASNKLIYIYIRRRRTAHCCTVWGYVRFNFSPHTPPPNSTVTYIAEDRERKREGEWCQWPHRVTMDSRGSRLWSICAGWSNIAVTSATRTCLSVTVWGRNVFETVHLLGKRHNCPERQLLPGVLEANHHFPKSLCVSRRTTFRGLKGL